MALGLWNYTLRNSPMIRSSKGTDMLVGSYDNFKRLQNSLNPKPLNLAESREVVQRRSVGAEAGAVAHDYERLQQQYENKLWKQSETQQRNRVRTLVYKHRPID